MLNLLRRFSIWGSPQAPFNEGARAAEPPLELPWTQPVATTPKRGPGSGFPKARCAESRRRARAVARATLGEEAWAGLERDGFLDVPSKVRPGLTYRLRVGHRIEVCCPRWVRSPWPMQQYICLIPAYPLPEEEFLAQLYLYVRDREELVLRVAVPQAYDQPVAHTF